MLHLVVICYYGFKSLTAFLVFLCCNEELLTINVGTNYMVLKQPLVSLFLPFNLHLCLVLIGFSMISFLLSCLSWSQ